MKRKINRVGQNTLTISLPSKWAKRYNLQPQEELEVIEDKNKLILSLGDLPKKEIKKVSFEIKENEEFTVNIVRKIIFSSYKMGFDQVELYFHHPDIMNEITATLENILGFEVISKSKNYCLIKNVASPLKESYLDLVNKIFLLTKTFAEDIYHSFEHEDLSLLNSIRMQEITQNKLCMACLRLLSEYPYDLAKYPSFDYFIISQLEAIGDDLKYVCKHYHGKKVKWDPITKKFFDKFIEAFDRTYSLYLKFDLPLHLTMAKDKHMVEFGQKLIETKSETKVLAHYLFSACLKLYDINRETFYRDIDNLIKKNDVKVKSNR